VPPGLVQRQWERPVFSHYDLGHLFPHEGAGLVEPDNLLKCSHALSKPHYK
jgi:hypothetical protein